MHQQDYAPTHPTPQINCNRSSRTSQSFRVVPEAQGSGTDDYGFDPEPINFSNTKDATAPIGMEPNRFADQQLHLQPGSTQTMDLPQRKRKCTSCYNDVSVPTKMPFKQGNSNTMPIDSSTRNYSQPDSNRNLPAPSGDTDAPQNSEVETPCEYQDQVLADTDGNPFCDLSTFITESGTVRVNQLHDGNDNVEHTLMVETERGHLGSNPASNPAGPSCSKGIHNTLRSCEASTVSASHRHNQPSTVSSYPQELRSCPRSLDANSGVSQGSENELNRCSGQQINHQPQTRAVDCSSIGEQVLINRQIEATNLSNTYPDFGDFDLLMPNADDTINLPTTLPTQPLYRIEYQSRRGTIKELTPEKKRKLYNEIYIAWGHEEIDHKTELNYLLDAVRYLLIIKFIIWAPNERDCLIDMPEKPLFEKILHAEKFKTIKDDLHTWATEEIDDWSTTVRQIRERCYNCIEHNGNSNDVQNAIAEIRTKLPIYQAEPMTLDEKQVNRFHKWINKLDEILQNYILGTMDQKTAKKKVIQVKDAINRYPGDKNERDQKYYIQNAIALLDESIGLRLSTKVKDERSCYFLIQWSSPDEHRRLRRVLLRCVLCAYHLFVVTADVPRAKSIRCSTISQWTLAKRNFVKWKNSNNLSTIYRIHNKTTTPKLETQFLLNIFVRKL